MSGKFKQHTPEFKAKVIKEMLKSEQTQAEIASKYVISTKTLQLWYSQFQDGIEEIFSKGKQEKNHKEEIKEKERRLNDAYREIGSLTTQISWIKKKCDQFGIVIPKNVD